MADHYVPVPGGPNNNNYANVELILDIAKRIPVQVRGATDTEQPSLLQEGAVPGERGRTKKLEFQIRISTQRQHMRQCSGCPSVNICRTGRFPAALHFLHPTPPQQLAAEPACTCLQGASDPLNSAHPEAALVPGCSEALLREEKRDLECLHVSVSVHLLVLFKQRANCFISPAGCVGWLGPCIREP